MNIHTYDSSSSGYLNDSFEGVSTTFTDIEILSVKPTNILVKAKRYGRWWLLKGLNPEVGNQELYRQRLRKEFEILMQAQHPGIVAALSLEEVPTLGKCIVMEYFDGITVTEWMKNNPGKKIRRHVMNAILEAVAYIHSLNIVHRDITPNNILISSDGHIVKLIDFGLADTGQHAVFKNPAGTLKYMSPEQMATSVPDIRNDIYSLGLVLNILKPGHTGILKKCLRPIDKRYQNVESIKTAMRRNRNIRLASAAGFGGLLIIIGFFSFFYIQKSDNDKKLHGLTEQTDLLSNENLRLKDDLSRQQQETVVANAKIDSLQKEVTNTNTHSESISKAIESGKNALRNDWSSWNYMKHLDTLSNIDYLKRSFITLNFDHFIYEYINKLDDSFSESDKSIIFQALKNFSVQEKEIAVQNKISALMAKQDSI